MSRRVVQLYRSCWTPRIHLFEFINISDHSRLINSNLLQRSKTSVVEDNEVRNEEDSISKQAHFITGNYWATPAGDAQFKIRSFIGVRNGIPMGRLLCCTISLASWWSLWDVQLIWRAVVTHFKRDTFSLWICPYIWVISRGSSEARIKMGCSILHSPGIVL